MKKDCRAGLMTSPHTFFLVFSINRIRSIRAEHIESRGWVLEDVVRAKTRKALAQHTITQDVVVAALRAAARNPGSQLVSAMVLVILAAIRSNQGHRRDGAKRMYV